MKRKIVFVTDCIDIAYNELRGTLLNLVKDEIEIEPVVPVTPFSIINGCFALRLIAESYPKDTIFSIILNPLKERPARLVGKTKKKNFIFFGANTGVFDWFLRDFGISELYELNDLGFFPFGGKYVHIPAVAKIINGTKLSDMGKPFDIKNLVSLNLKQGTIIHIDNFGLIKFIGDLPKLEEGKKIKISINKKIINAVFSKRMMSRETGKWVIYPGSSLGLPEIGKVRSNGALDLKAKVGDVIKLY